jgi:hypothetical protein
MKNVFQKYTTRCSILASFFLMSCDLILNIYTRISFESILLYKGINESDAYTSYRATQYIDQ